MPRILISYRRSDTSAITGRIFDRLTAQYGEESVFMDVDSIPIGTDFRSHIQQTLLQTDVVVAVIGANWLGRDGADGVRMHQTTDSVRVEIETAFDRKIRIVPVLVDGAKMPANSELPPSLGNFVFLNAADVATGRDFRSHMDRLIEAIDQSTAVDPFVAPVRSARYSRPGTAGAKSQLSDGLRYLVVPLVLLLVAHHLIVNAYDLNTNYLWTVAALLPFASGFVLFWVKRSGEAKALGFAVALGVVAVVGMTVSQSLNSGDPMMPQTRFEWWDNINFTALIALSFLAGHAMARALHAVSNRKAT